jgi:hypothetical protein
VSKSVDVLVAEAREQAREEAKMRALALGYGGMGAEDCEKLADAAFDAAGFPAMVEALSVELADAELHHRCDEDSRYADECPCGATQRKSRILAALGGVRVSGRAELEAEKPISHDDAESLHSALNAAASVVGGERVNELRALIDELRGPWHCANCFGFHPHELESCPERAAVDGETTTTKGSK